MEDQIMTSTNDSLNGGLKGTLFSISIVWQPKNHPTPAFQ